MQLGECLGACGPAAGTQNLPWGDHAPRQTSICEPMMTVRSRGSPK
jgi:hypothetical protein